MDIITFAVTVVLIALGSVIFAYFQRRYSLQYWQSRNIPCIEPSFFNGNMENVGKKYHLAYAIKKIYDEFKGTGTKYCGSYFWTRPIAILLDLDLMKDIWIRDFNNFTDRGMYYNARDDPLSANLATLDGDEWKHLRVKLTPTFTSGKMKFIFPTIVQVAECLNEVVKEFVNNQDDEVNVKEFFLRYTADVIGTTAFGIECNSLKDPNSEFLKMAQSIVKKPRHSAKFYILITTFANTARKLGIKMIHDDVSSFFMKAIKQTVEYREKNNVRRNDVMDILLDLKNQKPSDAITFDELAGQAFVFFVGGFDSTMITLTNCFYELAVNRDIQEKARAIIRKSFEQHNEQFSYEMLSELTYIEQIIKETLRKYPLSGSLNRRAKRDYHVPGTNLVIEKGTWIKLPVFGIHHDPEYYPDPDKFDPDRFEANEFRKRHIMTFMTFGDGPRGCIGERFALMNMQIAVTMLLKDFEFSMCDKTVEKITFNPKRTFLTSNEDIILKIRPIIM